jgi:hypothetical protein
VPADWLLALFDIATIGAVAWVGGIVAQRLGQPRIAGEMAAVFIAGPLLPRRPRHPAHVVCDRARRRRIDLTGCVRRAPMLPRTPRAQILVRLQPRAGRASWRGCAAAPCSRA